MCNFDIFPILHLKRLPFDILVPHTYLFQKLIHNLRPTPNASSPKPSPSSPSSNTLTCHYQRRCPRFCPTRIETDTESAIYSPGLLPFVRLQGCQASCGDSKIHISVLCVSAAMVPVGKRLNACSKTPPPTPTLELGWVDIQQIIPSFGPLL